MFKKVKLINAIVGLLILQFILGMLSNMYGSVPKDKPYMVFHSLGYIFFHGWNAVLLIVLGVIFLVKSVRHKQYVSEAIIGFAGLAAAYAGGIAFVLTQRDPFSLVMALGFLAAFANYLTVAVKTRAGSSRER